MSDEPYYADELVTLYRGDCLTLTVWAEADALLTDPPYGRDWKQGGMAGARRPGNIARRSAARDGIANDKDTSTRDAAMRLWGGGATRTHVW